MRTRLFRLICASVPALTASTLVGVAAASAAGPYHSTTSSYYTAVACPTAQVCVAVGAKQLDHTNASGVLVGGSSTAIAARSADGGKTWAPLAIPVMGAQLNGVSCWSADQCVAVGATEVVTGGSWSSVNAVVLHFSGGSVDGVAKVPTGALALSAVSCPSQAACVAVGGSNLPGTATLRPQVLVSHDQGAVWVAAPLPITGGELQGVSCTSPSHCVAVGVVTYTASSAAASRPVAVVSSSGGSSWKAAAITGGGPVGGLRGGGPDAVSCSSATNCTAVGDNFDWCQCGTGTPGRYAETWTTANGGRSWAVHSLPAIGGYDIWYANAISCWGATRCAMAGTGTTTKPRSLYYALFVPLTATSGGVAGAATSSKNGALRPQYINGLVCLDAVDCVAVGQNWARSGSAAIETRSQQGWATTFIMR